MSYELFLSAGHAAQRKAAAAGDVERRIAALEKALAPAASTAWDAGAGGALGVDASCVAGGGGAAGGGVLPRLDELAKRVAAFEPAHIDGISR